MATGSFLILTVRFYDHLADENSSQDDLRSTDNDKHRGDCTNRFCAYLNECK